VAPINQVFFGRIEDAKIENLGLENCTISGTFDSGGLVGNMNKSIISNCYVIGSINGEYAGTGGLVGNAKNSTISNCYTDISVTGWGSAVGGLVGNSENSTISNCNATGEVEGTNETGGLIGENSNSPVSNCYATVHVNGSKYTGGLVGTNNSNITNCYATGNVNGEGNIGGLVGDNGNASYITYCYATGIINGTGNYVAGLVGSNSGTVHNCVAANATVYTSATATGINRITGNNGGTANNNYANINMIVANATGYVTIIEGLPFAGTGKDMETLKSLVFYNTASNWRNNAWDIDSPNAVWKICDSENLPFLRREGISCGTGISELESSKIKIYPNPTYDNFTVEYAGTISIKLYDMLGKELFTQNANDKANININHLSKGIYTICILSDGKIIGSSKIVKQ
jgi:hypothetical protein